MEGSKSEQLGEVTQVKVLRGSGDPSSISKILGFGSPDLYFYSQFHGEQGTGLMPWSDLSASLIPHSPLKGPFYRTPVL